MFWFYTPIIAIYCNLVIIGSKKTLKVQLAITSQSLYDVILGIS